jgi:hypothetical protein
VSAERARHFVVSEIYGVLAAGVDFVHALAMLVWGLGLPLLVWHRHHGLSRTYMWFAIAFVAVSVASHQLLGECVLTTLARHLWQAGGGYRDGIPFTALLANTVAGLRPSTREVVLLWELAIVATSIGSLWCWHRTHPKRRRGRAATLVHLDAADAAGKSTQS